MSNNIKICEAMEEAGIADPASNAGIQFCLNCPYPSGCVVLEDTPEKQIENAARVDRVKFLSYEGKTKKEIAKILNISERTVYRHLRRLR